MSISCILNAEIGDEATVKFHNINGILRFCRHNCNFCSPNNKFVFYNFPIYTKKFIDQTIGSYPDRIKYPGCLYPFIGTNETKHSLYINYNRDEVYSSSSSLHPLDIKIEKIIKQKNVY